MNKTLFQIREALEKVIAALRSAIPSDEPFSNAHGTWTNPGVTRNDLIREAQSILDLIESHSIDDLGDSEAQLADYVRRLDFLAQTTIPNIWGNAAPGVPAFMFTMDALRNALEPVLNPDNQREAIVKLRKLTAQVRGMEARLNGLEPRTASIASMVDAIERAYNAADQLPTDLESLAEAKNRVDTILAGVRQGETDFQRLRENAEKIDEKLHRSASEAEAVLKRSETAYSAATSVGLAVAFSERSKQLSTSMWVWVIGLIIALAAGGYFGTHRLQALVELFKDPNQPSSLIYPNVLLSLLSVGAPIWFGWLSTKQIGQRFRLSEDYAFKASISRAYEGFRREAARLDPDLEHRLLSSALTRLDEQPLRLVEAETHGSPWNELANSDLVKDAVRSVPGFVGQVRDLAEKTIARVTPSKAVTTTAAPEAAKATE
ncbi:hypothetical protein ACNJYD_08945 [Bradyrhizobium sp. DASA03005]|uniref:hypothetical protein n=1 Tax=Bradyrhizobium sp. SPXBL-02 TaxID=3395912 RepID=UPI003F709D1E